MKRFKVTHDGGELILEVRDDATPEEVAAEAERRVAELKAEETGPAPELPPPPPPPWVAAGVDPLEQELRCTRCGGVKKRRDMQRHLRECFP